MNAVDADFIPTMKLQIASGRNFLHDNSADIKNAMIINEAMAKEYGWTEPIGKKLPGSYEQKVIGVVKDFHFESLHNKIQPLALVLQPDSMFRHSSDVNVPFSTQPRISVRLRAGNLADQMAFLKKAWKSVAEGQDFDYRFLDDSLDAMYRDDQRLGTIVRWASFLSILIACMGLFGLATLIVSRRTREIGIRKVLGADVRSLVGLLSKDFAILVGVASVIAFPIAWWALRQWLQDFAYRIRISWWVFLLAALIALLIAMITVGFQAFRAALTNPVKTLRNE